MRLVDQKRKKYAISISAVILIIAIIIGIKIKKNSTIASVSNGEKLGANSNGMTGEAQDIAIDSYIDDVLIQNEEEETEPTEEEIEEGKKNISSEAKYYIKINYQANVVTVYQKKDDGEYTPIKAMTCSTGVATPRSGVYSVQGKWTWGALFGNVWGHYVTKIVGNILFHSVPYLSADPSNLEYWEYDKLGTSASAGCVRLSVADAQWIFNNMPSGTPIEFYGSSDPGPLGKPGTRKISDNVECRGWDPTDPDPNNPWRNISEPEETKIEEPKEKIDNKNVVQDKPENQVVNNSVTNTSTNTSSGNNQVDNGNTINNDNTQDDESSSEGQESTNENNENESNNNENNQNNQEAENSQNENQEQTDNNSNDGKTVENDNNQE